MKIFGLDIRKAASTSLKVDENKLNELLYQFIGQGQIAQPYSGLRSTIDQAYLVNEKIYSIVGRILAANKGVPWAVYEVKDKQKFARYAGMQRKELRLDIANELKENTLEYVENDITRVLEKPNKFSTIDFIEEQAMGYYLLTGNSYLYTGVKRPSKQGEPLELHVMPSHLTKIEFGTWVDPVKGYVFNDYIAGIIPASDVIHARTFNPDWSTTASTLYGMPPLRAAWKTLQSDNEALTAQLAAFLNSGAHGILTGTGDDNWTTEQAEAIKAKWRENNTGSSKFRDIVFAAKQVAWTQIGISPVDLAIITARQMSMRDLCNVYKVPVQLFNDNSASTYNNMKEARKMMVMDAALPLKEIMKDMLNRAIKPYCEAMGKEYYIDYDINAYTELQDDMDSLWSRANTSTFITGNEKREMTGFERLEAPIMDEVLLNAGSIPASALDADMFNEPEAE